MKKKKLSQALPRKLTSAELIDFCMYIHGGISAGLSIDQALSYSVPFLDPPLREEIQIYSTKRRLGVDRVEALCDFANSFSEEAVRRIVRFLIFASSSGTSIPSLLEILVRSLERGEGLTDNLSHELKTSDFKDTASDESNDQEKEVVVPKSIPLLLTEDFLEKQNFWKFLMQSIEHDQSVLLAGFPSVERTQLIRRLQKYFVKTIEFNSSKPIDFLTAMSEQRSTLGIVNGPNIRAALNQIDLYASEQRVSPAVIRNSITQIFSLGLSIGNIGKHNYVDSLSEIAGMHGKYIVLQDLFYVKNTGLNKDKKPLGYYMYSGTVPRFVDRLETIGISTALMKTYFSND